MNQQKRTAPQFIGIALIGLGAILLAGQLIPEVLDIVRSLSRGAYEFLREILSWKSILIFIGLYLGYRRKFGKPYGWGIPIFIGLFFMIFGHVGWQYFFPAILIMIGAVILADGKGKREKLEQPIPPITTPDPTDPYDGAPSPVEQTDDYLKQFETTQSDTQANSSAAEFESNQVHDTISSFDSQNPQGFLKQVSIFSGSTLNVQHKISGGELVAIFGGNDINLSAATIDNIVVLDLTQIFGGTKLIIPAHWQVINQITAFMGGLEDKRPLIMERNENSPTLILKGLTILGGVDIRSW
jgi:hypothetical protein